MAAMLVRIAALERIIQQLAGLGVDADFISPTTDFNVERVSETATTAFTFKFLIRDGAGSCLQRYASCRLQTNLAGKRIFLTLEGHCGRARAQQSEPAKQH